MKFYAEQVKEFVPVWNLIAYGEDVGLITNFPGEGWVYTVKHGEAKTTCYACVRLHEAVERAKADYAELIAQADQEWPDEEPIDDEDGEIARMRWEENRAEAAFQYHYGEEPDY
ncbi:hypothetical protein RCXUPER_235 [Rhodobacter phage RcXuper]|nr:hypothetical protein RCXUPER_235 [Rhodobacter phage RcXuper]